MKKPLYLALLMSLLGGLTAAQAAVIDFNADTSLHSQNGPYQEDGFQLVNKNNTSVFKDFQFWGTHRFNADPGGNTMSINSLFSTTTLTMIGGGLFDFSSIELTSADNSMFFQVDGAVVFDFVFGNGQTAQQTVTIDSLPGLQAFLFNLVGLKSVSWTPLRNSFAGLQMDDINVSPSDVVLQPVPLPAAFWLFGSALTGMVGLGKRKKA